MKKRWIVWNVEKARLETKPTDRKSAYAYADAMEAHTATPMVVLPA